MGREMDNRRTWHVDKGINPAYLAALATIVIPLIAWASVVNSTQATHDTEIKGLNKRVDTIHNENREDLRAINDKLDVLLQRKR